jgi:hypothetical protein
MLMRGARTSRRSVEAITPRADRDAADAARPAAEPHRAADADAGAKAPPGGRPGKDGDDAAPAEGPQLRRAQEARRGEEEQGQEAHEVAVARVHVNGSHDRHVSDVTRRSRCDVIDAARWRR